MASIIVKISLSKVQKKFCGAKCVLNTGNEFTKLLSQTQNTAGPTLGARTWLATSANARRKLKKLQ
jgi:hypothetical protein